MRGLRIGVLSLAGLAAGSAGAQEGLYLSLGAGINELDDSNFDIAGPVRVDNEYDSGTIFLGALGYHFGPVLPVGGLRGEVELSFRDNDIDVHSVQALGGDQPGSTGEASTQALMGNLLLDFDTGTAFTPYVGGGIGYAWSDLEDYGIEAVPEVLDDDDSAFAWQLIGGIGFALNQQATVTLDYRYFTTTADVTTTADTGSVSNEVDLDSDTLTLGLRFRF